MKLQLTIEVNIEDNTIFDKNKPDEVIWFLEKVLSSENLSLYSSELEDDIGIINKITDIIEI